MADRSFVPVFASLFAGPLIWFAHFLVIYGFITLACTRGFADATFAGVDVVPLTVVTATAVAILATAAVIVRTLRHHEPPFSERADIAMSYFLRWITVAVAGLSLVPILWEGLTAAIVPACA